MIRINETAHRLVLNWSFYRIDFVIEFQLTIRLSLSRLNEHWTVDCAEKSGFIDPIQWENNAMVTR